MNNTMKLALKFTLVLAFFVTLGSVASAQATRTWVSGVGDDANPCSRTAPCKTFAGAIAKTTTGGEIDVLDPGGFGALTITKSISIESEGVIAGVLVSGTNGFVISAPGATVTLRGLTFEGLGTGLNGITVLDAGNVIVEHCFINAFTQKGINFAPATAGTSTLVVRNTVIQNNNNAANGGGIFVAPGAGVTAVATIDDVTLFNNAFGLRANDGSKVTVRNTTAKSNTTNGFIAFSASSATDLTVVSSLSSNNGTNGLQTNGASATARIYLSAFTGNAIGLNNVSGTINSANNNLVNGNTTDTSGTITNVGTK